MGAKIDWLDKIIGNICIRRDRFALSRREEQLETRLTELLRETEKLRQMLEEVRAKISIKGLPSNSNNNDKFCILSDFRGEVLLFCE